MGQPWQWDDCRTSRGDSMTGLVNLTPHEVVILDEDGASVHVAPDGAVLRCEVYGDFEGTIEVPADDHCCDGQDHAARVGIRRQRYGAPTWTPVERVGTIYIVSYMAAASMREHFPHREDIVYPGEAIRNPDGVIVACKGLCRV